MFAIQNSSGQYYMGETMFVKHDCMGVERWNDLFPEFTKSTIYRKEYETREDAQEVIDNNLIYYGDTYTIVNA